MSSVLFLVEVQCHWRYYNRLGYMELIKAYYAAFIAHAMDA